ncbi:MAG: Na+/H+ antiporter subunit B [Propionivibrio sp.]
MGSLILRKATRYLFPVIMMFSIYLLLRGHNEPGGGFVGGLAAASAFILNQLAFDVPSTKRLMNVDSLTLIGTGLLTALGSSVFTMLDGQPYFSSHWATLRITSDWQLLIGTPLIFDIGVYLVVLGVTLAILLSISNFRKTPS